MERREMHARLGEQMQSPRGKREGLYLYSGACVEPTRDSLSFLCGLPTQAHPKSETAPPHTLASFPLSAQPKAPNSTWGLSVSQVSLKQGWYRGSPPTDQTTRKSTLTGVQRFCLCSQCPSASRATQEGKEPVCGWGSRRGSGCKGKLAIAQPKSPVAWTEFFPLCGTGAQHSEAAPAGLPAPPWTWMGKGRPARTLTQAAKGPQFQAEVGLSAPCGTPSAGS